jgi:hypothetical protein
MTVLVDEALSIYVSAFLSSPDYLGSQKKIERVIEKRPEPNGGDYKVLTEHIDNS